MIRQYDRSRRILTALLALLYVASLISCLLTERGKNWIYYGHGGTPAPCADGKGYWPRDCR
jgi:hypothetical protein